MARLRYVNGVAVGDAVEDAAGFSIGFPVKDKSEDVVGGTVGLVARVSSGLQMVIGSATRAVLRSEMRVTKLAVVLQGPPSASPPGLLLTTLPRRRSATL